MTFEDALKQIFYNGGDNPSMDGTSLCLLDSAGNILGSDKLGGVRDLVKHLDDVVDMGLPSGTLWGKKNLGATEETGYGWYFSWGNTEGHQRGAGYNFDQTTYNSTPAASIGGNLTLAQDAANANLGGMWHMPSKEQFAELFDSSNTEIIDADGTVKTGTDKRTTYNGVVGLLIRSKSNGNTLFFPAAGVYVDTSLNEEGVGCGYWSSSYSSSSSAYDLRFNTNGVYSGSELGRRFGFAVRPVIG